MVWHFITALIDFIMPHWCCLCDTMIEQIGLCESCKSTQQLIAPYIIDNSRITVVAAAAYRDKVAVLVKAKHTRQWKSLLRLAHLMIAADKISGLQPDLLVPVPSSLVRQIVRGYNPSYEIASLLSRYYKVPMYELVRRTRHTSFQMGLSRTQRFTNVLGSFQCTEIFVVPQHILLIDDVMTTGATLAAVARAIRAKYPHVRISAYVAARAL